MERNEKRIAHHTQAVGARVFGSKKRSLTVEERRARLHVWHRAAQGYVCRCGETRVTRFGIIRHCARKNAFL